MKYSLVLTIYLPLLLIFLFSFTSNIRCLNSYDLNPQNPLEAKSDKCFSLTLPLQGSRFQKGTSLNHNLSSNLTPQIQLEVLPHYQTARFKSFVSYLLLIKVINVTKNVTIHLKVSGLPFEMNPTFGETRYLSKDSATVELLLYSGKKEGVYSFNVTASAPNTSKGFCNVQLRVVNIEKDFSLPLNRYNAKVVPGGNLIFSVYINPINGYNRLVALSCPNLPEGFKIKFTPSKAYPSYNVQINLSIPENVKPQEKIFVIEGEDNQGLHHASIFRLGILEPGSIDFKLKIKPEKGSVLQGGKIYFKVEVINLTQEKDKVFLFVKGIPNDTLYGFGEDELEPPGESDLVIQAGNITGTYLFTVYGVGGGLKRITHATLTIKKKECFIATATFNSEVSDEVNTLRKFRDSLILKTYTGTLFYKVFDEIYYAFSPQIAEQEKVNPSLKLFFKFTLYPLIYTLKLATFVSEPLSYINLEAAALTAGAIASFLLGFIYISPLIFVVSKMVGGKVKFWEEIKVFLLLFLISSMSIMVGVIFRENNLTTFFIFSYIMSFLYLGTVSALNFLNKFF